MKNPIYEHSHLVHHHHPDSSTYLFAHNVIKMMWASMISLFIPSFLYIYVGLDIRQIMMFMAIMSFVNISVSIIVGWPLLQKYWPKIIMIVGTFFFALYILIIYLSKIYYDFIFLGPLFSWIYTWLFWTSFHYNNATIRTHAKDFGSMYTNFAIFSNIGIALGPVIWWFLITYYEVSWIVTVSITLILFSIIPLMLYQEDFAIIKNTNYSIKTFFEHLYLLIKEKKTKVIYKTFAVVAYNNIIASIIWPLLIFLFVSDFKKIWIIGSATTICTILVLYIMGKIDKDTNRSYIKMFTLIQSWNRNIWAISTILWLLISPLIIMIDVIQKVLSSVNDNTIDKSFFDYTDSEYKDSKIYPVLLREIALHGTKIILFLFLALFYYHFPVSTLTLVIPMIVTILLVTLSRNILKLKSNT
jgi:MFS family permease